MGALGSAILGRKSKVNQPVTPEVALRFSTAVLGRPHAIGWGRFRVSPNVVWYGDFYYTTTQGSSGGKGGVLNPGSKGGSQDYVYFVSVVFSICDGPIHDITTIWYNSTAYPPPLPNAVVFGGDYAQEPWGYLTANHPDQALAYRGEALYCLPNLNLGESNASLPNLSFEIVSPINLGFYDANPADVFTDFLTNATYGIPNWPSDLLADLTPYRDYCTALDLVISPVLTDQTAAYTWMQDIATATNAEFRWSSGKLDLIPYADQSVSGTDLAGNTATFTANTTPVYDLTADDFLVNQGTLGQGTLSGDTPIVVSRTPRAQAINHMKIEFLDRGLAYNSNTTETWDEAAIIDYGDRPSDLKSCHMFCYGAAASMSCALQLARAQILCRYQFTLGSWAILLDPMDIVTLTDPNLGLVQQPVRITEIQENTDGTLTFTADIFLGTVSAPLYVRQAALGTQTNYNVAPGPINAPIIFEPPYLYADELAVSVAVSGQDTETWGGCNVWVSNDDVNYTLVGSIHGASRMGVTTADLPAVTGAVSGATIDSTNTLSVNLAESDGTLVTASAADMLAANTASYVGGEIIAYQNAALTGANAYNLSPLLRGAFDSTIADHPAGTPFVRLDSTVLQIPYTQDRIGSTIYLKFASFNVYGGGLEDLSTVGAVPYTITGSPLLAPVATPQNLRTVFTAGFEQLSWDEITDFRSGVRYKITRGDSAAIAQQVGDVAHPPFTLLGAGVYYVTAYVQPIAGLKVASTASTGLSITGNMLVTNTVRTWDQQAEGWTGTLSNLAIEGNAPDQFLSLTGGASSGTYTIPTGDIINLGYEGVMALNVTWKAVGALATANILSVADFLAQTDVLGAANSAYVTAYPEVQIGVVGSTDVFTEPDIFSASDAFSPSSISWGPWQPFEPGTYQGQYANFRMQIASSNPEVIASLIDFSVEASVEDRIDHYQNVTVGDDGLTIVFQPDDATTTAPFNGGPNGASVPYVSITYQNQPGDQLVITALSLSAITVKILNGGVGVTRSGVNIDVEGY